MDEQIKLSKNVLFMVMNYLKKRPFEEVAQLISTVSQNIEALNKPEESTSKDPILKVVPKTIEKV